MKAQSIEQKKISAAVLRRILIGYPAALLLSLLQIAPCIASVNVEYNKVVIDFVLDTPVTTLSEREQWERDRELWERAHWEREYPTILRPDDSCTEGFEVVAVSENGYYIGKLVAWVPEGGIFPINRYLLIQNKHGDTIVEMNSNFPLERMLIANNGRFVLHSIRYPFDDLCYPEIVISIFDATGTMVRHIKEGYGRERGFAYSDDGSLLFALLRRGHMVILKCFNEFGQVLWAKLIDNISLTNTLEGLRYDSATETIEVRACESGDSLGVTYVYNEQGELISKDTFTVSNRH